MLQTERAPRRNKLMASALVASVLMVNGCAAEPAPVDILTVADQANLDTSAKNTGALILAAFRTLTAPGACQATENIKCTVTDATYIKTSEHHGALNNIFMYGDSIHVFRDINYAGNAEITFDIDRFSRYKNPDGTDMPLGTSDFQQTESRIVYEGPAELLPDGIFSTLDDVEAALASDSLHVTEVDNGRTGAGVGANYQTNAIIGEGSLKMYFASYNHAADKQAELNDWDRFVVQSMLPEAISEINNFS